MAPMKLLAIILLLVSSNPSWAEDSPWFGSEASIAEQINLSSDQLPAQSKIVLNTKPDCLIETCPVTDKLAK
jgi:hypothetical protein